jgi:hypothetical protein
MIQEKIVMIIPLDPKLQKDLAEEHQREILEDIEAERIAEGDIPAKEEDTEAYKPVTDDKDDLIPTHRQNRHIRKD